MSDNKDRDAIRRTLLIGLPVVVIAGAALMHQTLTGRATGGGHGMEGGCAGEMAPEQTGAMAPGSEAKADPGAPAEAPQGQAEEDEPETLVRVPEDVATIQAAIDRITKLGRVQIGPGTYQEEVRIAGKTVHLVGTALELEAPEGEPPEGEPDLDQIPMRSETEILAGSGVAVTFGPGGAGAVRDLVIRGGEHAILGRPAAGEDADPVGAVTVHNVDIRETKTGVSGSFSELHVFDTEIIQPLSAGISVAGVPTVKVEATVVVRAGGAGIRVDNRALPADQPCVVEIEGTISGGNQAEGVWIGGAHCDVSVRGDELQENRHSGLTLWEVRYAEVDDTNVMGKHMEADGIRIHESKVDLSRSVVNGTRAAVAVVGCARTVVMGSEFRGNATNMNLQAGADCPAEPVLQAHDNNDCFDKQGKKHKCEASRQRFDFPMPPDPVRPESSRPARP